MYKFVSLQEAPVLDISPHHVRMVSCYMDQVGRYHLFIDYIDTKLATIHSFEAEIRYYISDNARDWRFVDIVVQRSLPEEPYYNYDGFGAGSPYILYTGKKALLFYSGRSGLKPGEAWNSLASFGEKGHITTDIMLSVAAVNETGAIILPFIKVGPVITRGYESEVSRFDDPCAVIKDGEIHLFYKMLFINHELRYSAIGHTRADINTVPSFNKDNNLVTDDFPQSREDSNIKGGEMPRVFYHNGNWQLFLRVFSPKQGSPWKHFQSHDLKKWKLINDNLFNSVTPGRGATDIMLIRKEKGGVTNYVLANGMKVENLKLYLYKLMHVQK